ncbi:MAG TPA: hypothetical protein DDZ19_05810 [Flavobacteriales bacterium]|jgi:hypothetical protein|nr:hypothetical protein [Flavobacteriales bacterium]
MTRFFLFAASIVGISAVAFGQLEDQSSGSVTGNVQMLWQSYSEDPIIGAIVPPEKTGFNAYGNLIYNQGGFSAGMRYESYLSAVLGFPGRFKGSGIGYRYARYADPTGKVDFTVGNFYEQFGSGIVLRSYEERALGIDNALDGVRLILRPVNGIEIKALYGMQRLDFDSRLINGPGTVRALDGTIDFNSLLESKGGLDWDTKIMLGGSFVSKFQSGGTIAKDSLLLQLPENIGAWSYRIDAMRKGWSAGIEYAGKINDPNADNGYTYRNGQALLFNLGYTQRGLGISLSAKTVDNMSFRSDRDVLLFDLPINYIPAITQQHTYNLAATLYPYATVISGESSASAEIFYSIPKGTRLGGKYGTKLSANFAAANGLDTTQLAGVEGLVYGYERNSWGFGPSKFVRDFNVQISRKESKNFKWKYTFYNLEFNTLATPVTTTFKGIVYADIHVLETQVKTRKRQSLRTEFQALFTDQDKGDWGTVLAEYTWSPHWFASVIDQYNFGNPDPDARVHYLYGAVGRIDGPHRLSIGYGKRREGIFCIGGVCRAVPASNGFEINFSSSF